MLKLQLLWVRYREWGNDDCDSDVASIFDEITADQTVRQDSGSDETDPSDFDAEIGPTDADDEEDEVASGIEPESSVRSTYKSKNPNVIWSKEPREIRGLLPKENIIQNKKIKTLDQPFLCHDI